MAMKHLPTIFLFAPVAAFLATSQCYTELRRTGIAEQRNGKYEQAIYHYLARSKLPGPSLTE